jgi:Zn-dependent peptidase ImmA (M78 family)
VVAKPKLTRGFAAKAERKAESLRQELGLQPHDPLCAFRLCEHLNINVVVAEQMEGITPGIQQELCNPSGKYWSALTMPYHPSQKLSHLIIHNGAHSAARQQSNVMHEVAHILCGHKLSAYDLGNGLPDYMRDCSAEQELEADCLGWTMLLPRPALLMALISGWDHAAIMQHYNASAEMVQLRINKTGVLYQLAYRR